MSNTKDEDDKDFLEKFIEKVQNIGIGKKDHDLDDPNLPQILTEFTLKGVVDYINEKKCRNIIIATGAGISTSAGIPDFRSPGTGLYDNLKKYNLPKPEAIFDIDFFKENPVPFNLLAKEMFPVGKYKPTYCHYFIKLLADKGLLLRNYTQNIDTLERSTGLSGDYLVEAHGSFAESECIGCKTHYPTDFVRDEIFKGNIVRCSKCDNLIKPKIVFFGESLPERFFQMIKSDFEKCDLLIVMGTSLKVNPFAKIITLPRKDIPRVLINRTRVGEVNHVLQMMGIESEGFDFDKGNRDVFYKGSCDDACLEIASLLGWKNELVEMKEQSDKDLEKGYKEHSKKIQDYLDAE